MSLLISALVLGCSQAQRYCAHRVPPPAGKPVVSESVNTRSASAVAVVTPAPIPIPQEVVANKLDLASALQEADASKPELVEQGLEQTGLAHPLPPITTETSHQRTGKVIAGVSAYGHAADYGWLTGELRYVHIRDVWKLRYAPADEDDSYGGSVTLVDAGPMTAYRNGQIVRVEGQMADSESHEPSPAYRVRSLQVVTPSLR